MVPRLVPFRSAAQTSKLGEIEAACADAANVNAAATMPAAAKRNDRVMVPTE